jgi:AraC-like DNA-binding protein
MQCCSSAFSGTDVLFRFDTRSDPVQQSRGIIPPMHSIKEAARRAGVTVELLQLWISTGRVKPTDSNPAVYLPVPKRPNEVREDFAFPACHMFDDAAIERIRALAEKPQAKRTSAESPGVKDFYSVAEVAALLNLSPDTIRRLFTDEPGVIALGEEHPRGKRKRITLRIPREVVERVKRKRAKK